MNLEKYKNNKIYNAIFALILISLVWVIILILSRSMFSGFHFTDDSEVININAYLSGGDNFFKIAEGVIENDLRIRFRPFYFFYRVLETKMFGTDFLIWSIHNFLLAIATTFIFFVSFRLLKFSFWSSLFAVLLLQLGPQACIWWRLGPNETIGIFLFSLAIFFLLLSNEKSNKARYYRGLFLFISILMSLCKESFVILLPAVYYLQVYLGVKKEQISWKASVRKYFWDGIILLFTMLLELYAIIFYVGTNKIGYAGVDRLYYLGYVYTFFGLFKANNIGLLIVFGFFLNLFLSDLKGTFKIKAFSLVKELLPFLIFAIFVIGPQVVLYTKSGLYDRYMTPGIFGFITLFLFLFERFKNKAMDAKLIKLFSVIVIVVISGSVFLAFKNAKDFADEGYNTREILKYLIPNEEKGNKYMIVTDPNLYPEWSYAIGSYLSYELKNDRAYIYPIQRKQLERFSDEEKMEFENFGSNFFQDRRSSKLKGDENFSTFVIFPRLEKTFLEKFPKASGIANDYKRIEIDDFVVYKKN